MKAHLASCDGEFLRLGFDIRTKQKKIQDARAEEQRRHNEVLHLARKYDRNKLYEEVWSEPMQKLAKKYNLSDVGLAKICKKLKIPLPGRGYWAKKAAGKLVERRPSLPEI
jgi:hypothetical protein